MHCARCRREIINEKNIHEAFGLVFGPECIKHVLAEGRVEFERLRGGLRVVKLYTDVARRIRSEWMGIFNRSIARPEFKHAPDENAKLFLSIREDIYNAGEQFWLARSDRPAKAAFIEHWTNKLEEAGLEV